MSNYVFLDTQVIKQYNFSVNNKIIKQLIEYIENEDIKLVISPIIIKEINKHIKIDIREFVKGITKRKILYTISDAIGLDTGKLDVDALSQRLICQLQEKLFDLGECVDLSYSNPNEVFQDYFLSKEPFQNGKTEFPDAFVANSLLKWAQKNGHVIAVVSGNTKDWGKICDREEYRSTFVFYESLSGFLSTLVNIIDEEEKRAIKKTVQEVFRKEFLSQFENIPITVALDLQPWDDCEEPEVDFASVKIEKMNIDIMCYDREEESAEIAVDGIFSFNSHVDMDDPETLVYDPEDRECILFSDRLCGIVEARREFSCLLTAQKTSTGYQIDSFEIDYPRNIELSWGNDCEYHENDQFTPDIPPAGEEL